MALLVYDGTGSKVFWKYPGTPLYKEMRIQLSEIAFSGQDTATIPTFHLGSRLPTYGEFGGLTYQFVKASEPGTVVLSGFFDPSVVLPRGLLSVEFRFARPPKYFRPPKIRILAGFSNGAFTVPMNAAATQVRTMKLSGVIKVFAAVRINPNDG